MFGVVGCSIFHISTYSYLQRNTQKEILGSVPQAVHASGVKGVGRTNVLVHIMQTYTGPTYIEIATGLGA